MNTPEMLAREIKASKLAAVCFKAGITVDELANATPEDWATCAGAAGCNPPNPKNPQPTIDRVMELLEKAYADAAAEADDKAEAKWEENQMEESGADRCPPRE